MRAQEKKLRHEGFKPYDAGVHYRLSRTHFKVMAPHRSKQARQITLISAFVNILQGGLKIIGGVWFASHALIADGVHSFADLISDATVLLTSHFGNQDPDSSHPYGHQRIETVGTLLVSLLLMALGGGIGLHAFDELNKIQPDLPTAHALVIAIASIIVNELLFFATLHVGKAIRSNLIKANAWHHRTDSASALVVALGILGSLMGYLYLDAIAAIIVSVLIIKMGVQYAWQSIQELIDTAVTPEIIAQIQQIITQVPGVYKIHQLRTRSMGEHVLVDVHILVFSYLSVSEGHYIAQHVRQSLIKQLQHVSDVTVHVDPEDDEHSSPSLHLPNRHVIEQNWLLPLQNRFPEVVFWTLHYLNGQLTIDLYLKNIGNQLHSLQHDCDQHILQHAEIKAFRLFQVL